MATLLTQTYSLNLIPGQNIVVVNVSAYDNSPRLIRFNMYNGSAAIDVSAWAARVEGTRQFTDAGFSTTATVSGSTVTFAITNAMTASSGRHRAVVVFYQGEDRVASADFVINVSKAALDESTPATEEDNTLYQQWIAANTEQIQQNTVATQQNASAIDVLSARMDTFAQLPSGSTSGDAELIDIRVAANGATYPTAGDAVRGQVDFLESGISDIGTLTTKTKTFVQGSAYRGGGGALVVGDAATRCRLWKQKMQSYLLMAKDGYQIYIYFTDTSGIIVSDSGAWVTRYQIPKGNTNDVTIVVAKMDNSNISPAEAEQNVVFNYEIIETIDDLATGQADIQGKIESLDGNILVDPNQFVIGAISITNTGWTRVASTKRVSTDIDNPITLSKGDIIRLSDYSNARMYIGYRDSSLVYGSSGAWVQTDYVCPIDGEYVITISNIPEIVLPSKGSLLDLLSIHKYDSLNTQIVLIDGLYSVPQSFTAEEVYTETYTETKAVQGLCTDGTYLYQAVMEQLGNDGAGTTIKKIRISDMSLVTSVTGLYGHCNDLCYDPVDNYILSIYKDATNYSVVSRFNAETLAYIDDIDLSGLASSISQTAAFAAITYMSDLSKFVIGVVNGNDLIGFAILTRGWSLERFIKVIPQERVLQGIDYFDGVIFATSDKQYLLRRIYAYDLHGNIINYSENGFGGEIEGIAILNQTTFFLSFNPNSYQGLNLFRAVPTLTQVSKIDTLAKYNLNY